jgi:enoyl-CoA hydratase/carnithine racemase
MSETRSETLILERPAEFVAVVTINRPQLLNAINTQAGRELFETFERLDQDDSVRCVILRGAGERAFCSGADLKERDGMSEEAWRFQHRLFEQAFRAILDCRSPVIAAVEGYAFAGGLELTLSCDIIIAGATAQFAQPEVIRGLMPGAGGTQMLPRLIGRGRAKELIFSGRRIDAETAERWGLVTRVVEAGGALAAALELANQIVANGPLAVRGVKRSINRGVDGPLYHGFAVELDEYYACIPTEDRYEGVRAFNEKRPPKFVGR